MMRRTTLRVALAGNMSALAARLAIWEPRSDVCSVQGGSLGLEAFPGPIIPDYHSSKGSGIAHTCILVAVLLCILERRFSGVGLQHSVGFFGVLLEHMGYQDAWFG
jgi:hypothetical protein